MKKKEMNLKLSKTFFRLRIKSSKQKTESVLVGEKFKRSHILSFSPILKIVFFRNFSYKSLTIYFIQFGSLYTLNYYLGYLLPEKGIMEQKKIYM